MAARANKRTRLYGVQPRPEATKGYTRIRSSDEYHTSRWTRESRAYRASNPLCVMCQKEGIIHESEVVDHVIPFPVCSDFFDQNNWQALCKKHNAEKGNKDKKVIAEFKNKK